MMWLYNHSSVTNTSTWEMDDEDGGSSTTSGSYGHGGYIAYSERLETYIVPVAFGIIFLIGVVGNGSLIWIFCRQPSVRSSVPNTFIFNLALGDLLVLFCSVPFTSTIYTLEYWPYGEIVCKASEFAKDTSVGVSVFTLTALSLDRYTAIVRPMQSFANGPRSKPSVIALLALIWFLSLALALPAAFFSQQRLVLVPAEPFTLASVDYDEEEYHKNITICYPFPEDLGPNYPKVVVLGRFLIHYCIPLSIIGTFYVITARHLFRSTQTLPGEATVSGASVRHHHLPEALTQQPCQNRTRRKVAKTVLSFAVLFAVCFLPFHVFFLWFYFGHDAPVNYNIYWHVLKIVGFCLAYTNSCVNPIALYCISSSFRGHFNRLLFCCCTASPIDNKLSRAHTGTHHGDGDREDAPYTDSRRLSGPSTSRRLLKSSLNMKGREQMMNETVV